MANEKWDNVQVSHGCLMKLTYILPEKNSMRKTLLTAPIMSSPNPSFDAVIEAAQELNHDQLIAWQKSGISLDITRADGTTPVMFFADKGQFEAAKIYAQYCPLAAAQQLKSAFNRAVQRNDGYGLLRLINFYDEPNFLAEDVSNPALMSEIYQESLLSAVTGQRNRGRIAMLIQEMFFRQISERSLRSCVSALRELPQSQELIHVLLRGIARGINSSYHGHCSLVCSGFNPVTDRLDLSSSSLTDSELMGFTERLFPRSDESFGSGYSFGYENEEDSTPPLKQLSLANNQLGRATGIAFAKEFNAHCALTVLDLSNNPGFGGGGLFWDSGLQKLVKSLHNNNTLDCLNLGNTGSNDRDLSAIVEMLKRNRRLRIVDASDNKDITPANEPQLKLLAEIRYKQKRHAIQLVLSNTALANLMRLPLNATDIDNRQRKLTALALFKRELSHGIAWVKFESFGKQMFAAKQESHRSDIAEFSDALLHCAQYAVSIAIPLASGIAASVAVVGTSASLLFSEISTIFEDLHHHHGLFSNVISVYNETTEAYEQGHTLTELTKKAYNNAEHRHGILKASLRLAKLSRDFSDKDLCELLNHQLYHSYEGVAEQLSADDARMLGVILSGCLSLFTRTTKALNWDSFSDDFHEWLMHTHPEVSECNAILAINEQYPYLDEKYPRTVWLINFLRLSGLKCLDSTGKEVTFDIQIETNERRDRWVSSEGQRYGYRRASKLILDKINTITEPYRRYRQSIPPLSEQEFCWKFWPLNIYKRGKLGVSLNNLAMLSGYSTLFEIRSDFKTTTQQLADLRHTQGIHDNNILSLQNEVRTIKKELCTERLIVTEDKKEISILKSQLKIANIMSKFTLDLAHIVQGLTPEHPGLEQIIHKAERLQTEQQKIQLESEQLAQQRSQQLAQQRTLEDFSRHHSFFPGGNPQLNDRENSEVNRNNTPFDIKY
jgi:hypothetical protein